MSNIGVVRRSSSLRRNDVRLTPPSLCALTLALWRNRSRIAEVKNRIVVQRMSSRHSEEMYASRLHACKP
mgnify:CR=1 FL=1